LWIPVEAIRRNALVILKIVVRAGALPVVLRC